MQLFSDRILNCIDCRSEFVFTAGEQLFFSDKQFKNDPKRCKPCKSRRSGLAAAAAGTGPAAAGLSRTETRTECSACGVETTVPFKPTQGRPVLCRQCFQQKLPIAAAAIAAPALLSGDAAMLTALSVNGQGQHLSAEAAISAAASMSSASAVSSVASSADLALVAAAERADLATADGTPQKTAELIARSLPDQRQADSPGIDGLAIALEAPPA